MSKYPTKSLEEMGIKLIDCEHRTPLPQKYGYFYVAIPDLVDGIIDFSDTRLISEEDYLRSIKKVYPQPGDIIITRRGRVGDSAVVPAGKKLALGQNLVILRVENEKTDKNYLRWLLRSPYYWREVSKYINVGAIFESLNCKDIPKFTLPFPDISTQERIGNVLTIIDNKIRVIQKINNTLESLAKLKFQYWFIDYEPFLNTDMKETEIGKIPIKWIVGSIDDIATYINGKAFTKIATPRGRVIIKISELKSGINRTTKFYDGEANKDHSAYFDDILFSWSASIGLYRWTGEDAVINQHIFKVIPKSYEKWFVYYHLLFALPWFSHVASSKETTMGHIKRSHLKEYKIGIPGKQVLEKVDNYLKPIYTKIGTNNREKYLLTNLRDILIPQLTSGNIDTRILEGINIANY